MNITDFVIFVISFYIAYIVSMVCECFVPVITSLSQCNLVKYVLYVHIITGPCYRYGVQFTGCNLNNSWNRHPQWKNDNNKLSPISKIYKTEYKFKAEQHLVAVYSCFIQKILRIYLKLSLQNSILKELSKIVSIHLWNTEVSS